MNSRWGFLFETRRRGEYLSWPFFWRGHYGERRVSRMGWGGVGGFSVSKFLQEHGVLKDKVSKLGYKFNNFLQKCVHEFDSCFLFGFILLHHSLTCLFLVFYCFRLFLCVSVSSSAFSSTSFRWIPHVITRCRITLLSFDIFFCSFVFYIPLAAFLPFLLLVLTLFPASSSCSLPFYFLHLLLVLYLFIYVT